MLLIIIIIKLGKYNFLLDKLYYYFKNILVGGACPFIWKAGVCGKNTILKTLYPWQFLCSGVARGCKRLVHIDCSI